MTQITTQYEEGSGKPIRITALTNKSFFRLAETATVWRVQKFQDNGTVQVLNLDDLEVETLDDVQLVIPVEVNSIDVKVELV